MKNKQILAGVGIPLAMLLLVCLISGLLGGHTDRINAGANVTANATATDEKHYQEGIELIKQGKWDDAAGALIFAENNNYKDSVILYNYAQAHVSFARNNDYSDANMADYYMKDIPDTYTGLFKDDIMKFKQECSQNLKVAEEELKAQYAPQKIVDTNGKQIWKVYVSSGYFSFTGTYTGTGNFIVKLSDSNQDLVRLIANEIGDYVSNKTVTVPYKGWYYLEIKCSRGSYTCNWS